MSWKVPLPDAWKSIPLPGGDMVFRAVYKQLLEQASNVKVRAARSWRGIPGYIYIDLDGLSCASPEHLTRGEIGNGIDVRCLLLYVDKMTIWTSFPSSPEEISISVSRGEICMEQSVTSLSTRLHQTYTRIEIKGPTEEMISVAIEVCQAQMSAQDES